MRLSSSPSTAAVVVAMVCVVLLTLLPTPSLGAATAASASPHATALPSYFSQAKAVIEEAVAPVAATLAPYVPASLRVLVPPFLHGAVSVVLVGPAARRPPPSVNGAAGDELLRHTTPKCMYAAGAIAAELTLLRLVYREPYRNLRRNPLHRLLVGPAGFVLLVLLTAMPNEFIDTSLACVLLGRLSSAVYTPPIVCGQLLRVYAAALVPRLPQLSVAYTTFVAYWDGAAQPSGDVLVSASQAWAEVGMAVVVLGAVLFCVAARRAAPAQQQPQQQHRHKECESDGDDYYEE